MKKIFLKIFLVAIVAGAYVFPIVSAPQYQIINDGVSEVVGQALPAAPASFETSLASPISSSATSLTLTSNSLRGGSSVSGFTCVTIDEGSAQREDVCGTLSGTSMTGLQRGVDPATGTSTVSALQFAHRRGANVKITDFPVITILRNQANGMETFPNLLSYANTVSIGVGSPTTTITTKAYVDSVAVAGASNGDESTKGIWEGATALEQASSTALGGTSAGLLLQSRYATDTPLSGCASGYTSTAGAGCSVIATLAGKIKQTWFNLAEAWTFLATTTIQASNVYSNAIVLNSLAYKYPSTRGASSSVMIEDGVGNLVWYDGGYTSPYNAYLSMSTSSSNRFIGGVPTWAPYQIASSTLNQPNTNCGGSLARMTTINVRKYGKVLAEGRMASGDGAGATTLSLSKNGLSTTSQTKTTTGVMFVGAVFDVVPNDEISLYCVQSAGSPNIDGLRLYATTTDAEPIVTY